MSFRVGAESDIKVTLKIISLMIHALYIRMLMVVIIGLGGASDVRSPCSVCELTDPSWVGAWWLGFMFSAAVSILLLSSIPPFLSGYAAVSFR